MTQTRARIYCADCGRSTAAVQNGLRDNGFGSRSPMLVCRAGTGCHKADNGLAVYDPDQYAPDGTPKAATR